MQPTTWALIPAHNEESRIVDVISKTKEHVDQVLVIDDGSTDKTYQVSKQTDVLVIKHIINLGKGAALKTGCKYAMNNGATQLVFIDADGQHNPDDIPRFLEHLPEHDIVFGSRLFNKKMPGILKFGNIFINKIIEYLYSVKLNDTQSGFRAMSTETYEKIMWLSTNYTMESEMVANVGKHKLKYKEITIDTIYADRFKGTTVIDGIKNVSFLLWWRLFGK